MTLIHAADPSAEAELFLDALSRLCDHYGVSIESNHADLPAPANRVHYLTAGDGPPLLLLHGLSTNAATWVPMFDALTDHFTVYAPDRPGRGLSTPVNYRETGFREFGVEYVVDFLDALDIEETAVMGNSLGGFQALALALDHPGRVTRQCLIGAPAGLSRDLPFVFRLLDVPMFGRWVFDNFAMDTVADARAVYRQLNVEDDSALPDVYFEVEVRGEDLPGQRESLLTLLETLASLGRMAPQFDLRASLPSVETPTRFVWGTEDAFWGPKVGRPAVERMPNAELVVLDGHGHIPWLEPGEDATEAAVEFLVDS